MRTQEWTQRDGTPIRICDMGDRHLLNTIRMLRRNHHAELLYAVSVPPPEAEMASYAFESAIDELFSADSLHPLYDDLTAEAADRGLTV